MARRKGKGKKGRWVTSNIVHPIARYPGGTSQEDISSGRVKPLPNKPAKVWVEGKGRGKPIRPGEGRRLPDRSGVTHIDVGVSKAKPGVGQQFEERMGPIKQTKAQEGEVEFGREQKQALVDRLKKYEYGKNKGAAQKDFYGGDYKGGTVKKLNKKIAAGKDLTSKAQKELESLGQQATATGDPNAQKQLEARKQSLSETYGKQQAALKQSEGERQKFLNLRNKRLKTIFTNMKANPRAVEADRRKKTRKKYRELTS